MTGYNTERVFSDIRYDHPVLGCINDITIRAEGVPVHSNQAVSVILESIQCSDKIELTFMVTIPVLGINTTAKVGLDDKCKGHTLIEYDTSNISIYVDFNDEALQYRTSTITYNTGARVRLNRIKLSFTRYISVAGGERQVGINLHDGYNIDIKYENGILYVTGGPGLGLGQYDGSTDPRTRNIYRGIKSINGVRSDQTVHIEFSDLLLAHGSSVTTGKRIDYEIEEP